MSNPDFQKEGIIFELREQLAEKEKELKTEKLIYLTEKEQMTNNFNQCKNAAEHWKSRAEKDEAENSREQSRWQDAIYKVLCKSVPDNLIDGAGCDSSDPLDLSLSEIQQGISYFLDKLAEREKEIERLKKDDLRGISNLASWLADYLCEKHNKEFLALKTYGDVAKFSEEKLGCAFCNRERAKKAEAELSELRKRIGK